MRILCKKTFADIIAAAFPGIWITSFEHEDALREIAALCKKEEWALATWDVDSGLHVGTASVGTAPDPLAALRALPASQNPNHRPCWSCRIFTASWGAQRLSSASPIL